MTTGEFIYLHEFPDYVRVLLDSEYLGKVKESLRKSYCINKLSRYLGVSPRQVRKYLSGDRSISINVMRKISKLLEMNPEFSLFKIQEHVVGYGIQHRKCFIWNPTLPLPEDPCFGAIVVHLLCDGFARRDTVGYVNSCAELRENFKKFLSHFGEVPIKGDRWKSTSQVRFPVVIVRILGKKYGMPNLKSGEMGIPKTLKNKPKSWLIEMLKAALVDEGSIDDNVYIAVKNKSLLNDLKEIAEKLGYTCGKVRRFGNIYRFLIFIKSIPQLAEDMKLLPHPHKQKALERILKRKKFNSWVKHWPSEIPAKLINSLASGPKTVNELSEELAITLGKIRLHLHRLERGGSVYIVKTIKKKGHPFLWGLKRHVCGFESSNRKVIYTSQQINPNQNNIMYHHDQNNLEVIS